MNYMIYNICMCSKVGFFLTGWALLDGPKVLSFVCLATAQLGMLGLQTPYCDPLLLFPPGFYVPSGHIGQVLLPINTVPPIQNWILPPAIGNANSPFSLLHGFWWTTLTDALLFYIMVLIFKMIHKVLKMLTDSTIDLLMIPEMLYFYFW